MAYRRPLSERQSILILLLWLAFLYFVPWRGMGLVVILFSAFFVLYPIYKSWRERRQRGSTKGKSSSKNRTRR